MSTEPTSVAEQQVAAFRALLAVTQAVHRSLDLDQTLEAVAKGVAAASGFTVAAVNMIQPDGSYRVVAVEGSDEIKAVLLGAVETAQQWQVLIAESRAWGPVRFIHHDDQISIPIEDFNWVPDIPISEDPSSWHPLDTLFAPLQGVDGRLIGVLSVDVPANGRLPDEQQLEMLGFFADHAFLAIEHALLHAEMAASREQLRLAATHDALTGLSNRSVLADRALAMAAADGRHIAVLVLDLDGFKMLNDTAGHQAGDFLLTVVAQRMRGCVRPDDILARTGGDEFAIVLSADNLEGRVEHLTERLRETITQPVVDEYGRSYQVGVSIGRAIAETPTALEQLLARADADMYRDKHAHAPLAAG